MEAWFNGEGAPLPKYHRPGKPANCKLLFGADDDEANSSMTWNWATKSSSSIYAPAPCARETSAAYTLTYDIPTTPTPQHGPTDAPVLSVDKPTDLDVANGQVVQVGKPGETSVVKFTITHPDGTTTTEEKVITGPVNIAVKW